VSKSVSPELAPSERPSIVLIGPSGAGKSTMAPLLADRLGLRSVDLDDLRAGYYPEFGYDEALAEQFFTAGALRGLTAYWKPFELCSVQRAACSVQRAMAEFGTGHVIAFGAGQSVYDDPADRAAARLALAGAGAVVLVQPTADEAGSAAVLGVRIRQAADGVPAWVVDRFDELNQDYVNHPSSRELATCVVLTGTRDPDRAADLVVERLGALRG